MEEEAFQEAKPAVQQAPALGVIDPTLPAELDACDSSWVWLLSVAVPKFCFSPLGSGLKFGTEQKKGTV